MTIQEIERPAGHATDAQMARSYYAKMVSEMQAVRKFLSTEKLDIDEWKWEQSATTIQPLRNYDGPIVVTAILAVFPATSTSAVINTGTPGRTIPIPILNQPAAPAINQIPLAATGVASYNNNSTGVNLNVSGGTVTQIAINGTNTNLTSGNFFVPAGGTVTITYTANPTLTTTALPATSTVATSSGIFFADDLKIQCGQDDVTRNLVIAPAGAAYINFIGYADRKVVDSIR